MQLRESIYVYLYETCKYGSHSFFLIYSICFMRTLQIQDVSLSFGDREILKDINLTMNEKSRAALVGANGSGKSTLLKVISGKISSESMTLSITKGARISYLPQSDIVMPDKPLYAAAEEGYSRFLPILEEMRILEDKTSNGGEEAMRAAEKLSEYHELLTSSGYYSRRSRIEMILFGLGFTKNDLERPAREFSGGYQMRIALARVLAESPDFLFLDEPTNYLDIEAMIWLEEYLSSFSGGIMLVSHDQGFLDDMVNEVYELHSGHLTRYAGNYTKYLALREEEIKEIEKAYERQQQEIEKTEEFIERFRYKATKAKQVQSRIKALDKIERIEIPGHLKKLSFRFPPAPHSGNDVLKAEHISKHYGENVIYSDFSFLVKKGERLAITGRNGAGKSTLLRIIAGDDNDYTGEIVDGAGVKKAYFAQDTENTLNDENTVLEEAESLADTKDLPNMRNMLGAFLFSDDDVFKKVSVLSGGEKSRLALLKILLHPSNLLLLDEPTNHLDINSKQMLLDAIKAYGGTVIFVSHDRHFIKNLATRILYLSEDGPEFFDGDYEYFERKIKEKEERFQIEALKKEEPKQESKGLLSHEESKKLRNRIRALERETEEMNKLLDELNEKMNTLEEEIAKPENYSAPAKITKLMKKKEELQKETEETEERWLLASEELEELNEENNRA